MCNTHNCEHVQTHMRLCRHMKKFLREHNNTDSIRQHECELPCLLERNKIKPDIITSAGYLSVNIIIWSFDHTTHKPSSLMWISSSYDPGSSSSARMTLSFMSVSISPRSEQSLFVPMETVPAVRSIWSSLQRYTSIELLNHHADLALAVHVHSHKSMLEACSALTPHVVKVHTMAVVVVPIEKVAAAVIMVLIQAASNHTYINL